MSTSTAIRPVLRRILKPNMSLHQPPSFLLPSLTPCTQTSSFSKTPYTSYPRDMNRERGVSTVRRTGPRKPLSMNRLTQLPKPVLDPTKRSKVPVDEDHGLWEFFHSKDKLMNTPEEDNEHGRSWCVEELRHKSWEDLHALWWICAKERNRIATEAYERRRLDAGYGDFESKRRDVTVRLTMRAIKQVLTERFYSWRDAQDIAADDLEVNLSGEGPAYVPSDFVEEDVVEAEQFEVAESSDSHPEKQTQSEAMHGEKSQSRPNA